MGLGWLGHVSWYGGLGLVSIANGSRLVSGLVKGG